MAHKYMYLLLVYYVKPDDSLRFIYYIKYVLMYM